MATDTFQELDEFTQSYIITAFWSSNDESDESGGEPLENNYDWRDLAPAELQKMVADCVKFEDQNSDLLDGLDRSRAGHDFWLTRNGHGAGFWDGDYEDAVGEKLTQASHAFGECDIYVGDDGKLYLYP